MPKNFVFFVSLVKECPAFILRKDMVLIVRS